MKHTAKHSSEAHKKTGRGRIERKRDSPRQIGVCAKRIAANERRISQSEIAGAPKKPLPRRTHQISCRRNLFLIYFKAPEGTAEVTSFAETT